jgi:hypothetical protein
MAVENERQQGFAEKARDVVASVVGKGFLGGELQAAIRQGFNELGSALKAFPDSIQVEEPGAVFNPLYRDMPGNPNAHGAGSVQATLPSPSEIAGGKGSATVHGNSQQIDKQSLSPSQIASQQQPASPQQDHGQDHDRTR